MEEKETVVTTADMLDALVQRIDDCMSKGLHLSGMELLQVKFVARKAASELRAAEVPPQGSSIPSGAVAASADPPVTQ